MMKASNNPYPSLLFEEHADPANPAAAHQRMFVDTDHALKMVDSAGTVTVLGAADVMPLLAQVAGTYQASGTTNVSTVAVATGALVCIVQSETRTASSITQTNVTWTQRYTGNDGGEYVGIWTGAKTGTPGTTVTVNFASATKSYCAVAEMDRAELTSVGTAVTSTTGVISLTEATAADGSLCIFAEASFNANTGYVACNQPVCLINGGGGLQSGVFYARTTHQTLGLVQSGAATRFAAAMTIS